MGKKPLTIAEMAREGEKARAAKLNKDSKIERKSTASRWPKKRAAK